MWYPDRMKAAISAVRQKGMEPFKATCISDNPKQIERHIKLEGNSACGTEMKLGIEPVFPLVLKKTLWNTALTWKSASWPVSE
jgi:hypothetical protein